MIDDIYKILRHQDKAAKLLKQIEDNVQGDARPEDDADECISYWGD